MNPSSPSSLSINNNNNENAVRLVSIIGGYRGGKTCLLRSLKGRMHHSSPTNTTNTAATTMSLQVGSVNNGGTPPMSYPYDRYHGYTSVVYTLPQQQPRTTTTTDQHHDTTTPTPLPTTPSTTCSSTSSNRGSSIGSGKCVVTLVDTLGHPDFLTDAACDMRLTDGALLVVDCCSASSSQYHSSTVLRQALTERIRPVIFINKVDRAIMELQLDPEEAYQCFANIIGKVNSVISTFVDPCMSPPPLASPTPIESNDAASNSTMELSPQSGTVAFGSGLQGWAFSISQFARMYASKFGVDESKMCDRLWGDSFFDAKSKKWLRTDTNADGDSLKRAFCQFCLDPIYQIFDAVMTENNEKIEKMLNALTVVLTDCERNQPPKDLLKSIMMKFLPVSDALLHMIVTHLPSPKTAQKYRAEMLYSGEPNADDKYYMGIKNCDQTAPLMMHVSKMIPVSSERGRFYTFGRIFSGTLKRGQRVRILGKDYIENGRINKRNVFNNKCVDGTFHLHDGDQISYVHSTDDGSEFSCSSDVAGCLVGLTGIDSYIVKTATITAVEGGVTLPPPTAAPLLGPYPFGPVPSLFAAHVARVSIEVARPTDLPKLVQALRWLSQSDSFAEVEVEHTGDHIVSVCGEAHLKSCERFLKMAVNALGGGAVHVSDPCVSYRETITEHSSKVALSKSANRANRIYGRAQPVGEDLCEALHNGTVTPWNRDRSQCVKQLVGGGDTHVGTKSSSSSMNTGLGGEGSYYGWTSEDAGLIWASGPHELPYSHQNNFLVDSIKGLQNKHEVKDSVVAAWKWSVKEGPLCEEPMRGVRTNLVDIILTADSIHRGAGQVMPPARRMTYGSFYLACPRLMEPFCTVTVEVHQLLPSSSSIPPPAGAPSLSCPHQYIHRSTLARMMSIIVSRGGININESQPDNISSSSGPNPTNIMKLVEYRSGVRTIVAEMPVSRAWGLQEALQGTVSSSNGDDSGSGGGSGYVSVHNTTIMDGWRVLPGDPTNTSSPAHAVVLSIRERKGLRIPLPTVDFYTDNL